MAAEGLEASRSPSWLRRALRALGSGQSPSRRLPSTVVQASGGTTVTELASPELAAIPHAMQEVVTARASAFPELPGIYPDVHKREIDKYFGSPPGGGSLDVSELKCVYLVCFTNRCGSNFVAQSMASDGSLKQPGEKLNFDGVVNWSKKLGFTCLEEYFSWLVQTQTSPPGVMGCKASIGQLLLLHEHGILEKIGRKLKVIHVVREDVIDQAVSLFIAGRTRQWTIQQAARDADVDASPRDIMRIAHLIAQQNAMFSVAFRLFGITPLTVGYDAFVRDPRAGISEIGRFIGVPSLAYKQERLTYKKQADARNERIKRSVVDHYRIR